MYLFPFPHHHLVYGYTYKNTPKASQDDCAFFIIHLAILWYTSGLSATKLSLTSNLRVLKILLLNLIVSWLMGTAIVRPPNTEYTQKTVKITLLQLYFKFSHGDFFHKCSLQYSLNICWWKKIVMTHNKVTKLQQVPYFRDIKVMFACFHSNEIIQPFIILIFQRPKVALHKFLI